jgi:hypothetical protein
VVNEFDAHADDRVKNGLTLRIGLPFHRARVSIQAETIGSGGVERDEDDVLWRGIVTSPATTSARRQAEEQRCRQPPRGARNASCSHVPLA